MRLLLTALALLAAACTSTTTTSVRPPTASPPPTATTTPAVTVTAPPADPCPLGDPGPAGAFVSTGSIGSFGSAAGDAGVVAGIMVTTPRPAAGDDPDPGTCERIVIDLASGSGAPATAVGPTRVEFLEGVGVVRISLPPAVTTTAIADMTVAGHILDRAFVVEGSAGLFVDLHLGRPAGARAAATRSPASIVVDVLGGGNGLETRPVAGDRAVVLAPLGPMATYPLEVQGYARADAGRITIEVIGSDGATTPIELPTIAYPWQEFTAVVPEGPSGSVRLSVGDAVVLLGVP